jgi:NAD+ synthase (glutamine-hydrolysing)
MKISAAALNQTPLDWKGNVSRILKVIDEARSQKADLLLLPELVLTGYGCEDYFFMPWVSQKAWDLFYQQILPQTKDLALALGMPFWEDGKLFNTLFFCEKGKIKGIYAKQLLPHTGIFYEPRWFCPWPRLEKKWIEKGDQAFWFGDFTVPFQGIQVGFEICEDAWQNDKRPALFGAAKDADVILNASASNFARDKRQDRHKVITDLAGKNDAYYLYANLLGNESGRIIFDGEILFGAEGEIWEASNRLSFKEYELATFEIESQRPEIPKIETEEDDFEDFTRAASLGLWDYLRKSGSKGYALSLSGGADSAACAVLVAEMAKRAFSTLGKEKIEEQLGISLGGNRPEDLIPELLWCLYQGTKNSSSVTREAAESLAKELNARYFSWEIDELVSGYIQNTEKLLGRNLSWEKDDLALQNIQARTRAPGIWLLANTANFLLLTTSNRSEGNVGYCTMDGDTAGSLAPLAGVSKHFIRKWLVWAKENLGYSSLDLIINQKPTAELRPQEMKQTDEADLMPYDILEQIENQLIWERKTEEEALIFLKEANPGFEIEVLEKYISRFVSLWKRSQWKRERLAPSFHLDKFNIDPKSGGRFPILSK